jgi:hypothetical protein
MEKIAKITVILALSLPSSYCFADGPTDLDAIFKGKEFQLPPLDSSYRMNYSETPQLKTSEKEQDAYTLQFDAVADFDVAQSRRARLAGQTGYSIQMVFDAPFYKLRGGYFKKKSEAEDKAHELSLHKISAFPVKIK